MNKPNKILLRLYECGVIYSIDIEYVQTGTDTAETMCRLYCENGNVGGKWKTYEPYLDVGVGYNYVAEIKSYFIKECEEWFKFEKENKEELEEYNRLKEKYG